MTPLIVAPIKSGPLELRCELTHNTTTTPLLALFSRLPHKFLPVRGLSVSLILCLYLSFFAPNSHRFSQSSLFFFFSPSGENIGQGFDSRKAARSWSSASFLFFPAFCSLTADSTHTVRIHVCCCLSVTQKARGRTAAYSSLSCTHFAISWPVSVSKEREFSFTALDVIKNNQTILSNTINLSCLRLTFYQQWCAGTRWTETAILQAESRPEV